MSVATKQHEPITLRSLATAALKDAEGQTEQAIEELVERLDEDKKLLKSIVAEAISDAVYLRVQGAMRENRSLIVASAVRSQKDGVIALAKGIAESRLLDFPLANGLKLRDATAEEVNEQIQYYESASRDMSHKARWLRLVVQGLPRDQKVGDVLTPARAQELWEETLNAE